MGLYLPLTQSPGNITFTSLSTFKVYPLDIQNKVWYTRIIGV